LTLSSAIAESGRSFLLVQVGERRCAIDVAHVVEVMRPLPVAPVDGAAAFVLGVAIVRGVGVPVVAGGALIGASEAGAGRFVALRVGDRTVVLAVDDVHGVEWLADTARIALPPLLRDAGTERIEALARLDDELLFVLRTARLIAEATP
jgi:purine-binding chemotaxis protein CheW